MADHLQKKAIRVSGHLEEKRGIYQMVLSWTDREGKRQRQSKSTGLQTRGNKKRAEDMLLDTRRAKERELASLPDLSDPLFADFMEYTWLEAVRQEVKLTTFGGYQMNVKKAIAPWFREKKILLRKLTAEDINDFYGDCLKRIKATSVLKFHANISKALKFAVKKGFVQRSVMEQVDRPKPQRFVGKFLTQSEVVALFEAVKGHKLELGVMLGAFYGLRRAEIVGLRWDAIDFEAKPLPLSTQLRQRQLMGNTSWLRTIPPKPSPAFVPFRSFRALKKSCWRSEQNRSTAGKSAKKVLTKRKAGTYIPIHSATALSRSISPMRFRNLWRKTAFGACVSMTSGTRRQRICTS